MGIFKKGEVVTIRVEGMTCEHCEKKVEDAASGLDGVKKANADRTDNTLTVQLKPKSTVSAAGIAEAVNTVGYTATT